MVLDIYKLIEKTTLIYTHKKFLENKIERVDVGTRSADKVTLKAMKMKTTAAQRLYLHKGIVLYNTLPIELLEDKLSLNVFKTRVKAHYLRLLEVNIS